MLEIGALRLASTRAQGMMLQMTRMTDTEGEGRRERQLSRSSTHTVQEYRRFKQTDNHVD
jgi:hypothetical protein